MTGFKTFHYVAQLIMTFSLFELLMSIINCFYAHLIVFIYEGIGSVTMKLYASITSILPFMGVWGNNTLTEPFGGSTPPTSSKRGSLVPSGTNYNSFKCALNSTGSMIMIIHKIIIFLVVSVLFTADLSLATDISVNVSDNLFVCLGSNNERMTPDVVPVLQEFAAAQNFYFENNAKSSVDVNGLNLCFTFDHTYARTSLYEFITNFYYSSLNRFTLFHLCQHFAVVTSSNVQILFSNDAFYTIEFDSTDLNLSFNPDVYDHHLFKAIRNTYFSNLYGDIYLVHFPDNLIMFHHDMVEFNYERFALSWIIPVSTNLLVCHPEMIYPFITTRLISDGLLHCSKTIRNVYFPYQSGNIISSFCKPREVLTFDLCSLFDKRYCLPIGSQPLMKSSSSGVLSTGPQLSVPNGMSVKSTGSSSSQTDDNNDNNTLISLNALNKHTDTAKQLADALELLEKLAARGINVSEIGHVVPNNSNSVEPSGAVNSSNTNGDSVTPVPLVPPEEHVDATVTSGPSLSLDDDEFDSFFADKPIATGGLMNLTYHTVLSKAQMFSSKLSGFQLFTAVNTSDSFGIFKIRTYMPWNVVLRGAHSILRHAVINSCKSLHDSPGSCTAYEQTTFPFNCDEWEQKTSTVMFIITIQMFVIALFVSLTHSMLNTLVVSTSFIITLISSVMILAGAQYFQSQSDIIVINVISMFCFVIVSVTYLLTKSTTPFDGIPLAFSLCWLSVYYIFVYHIYWLITTFGRVSRLFSVSWVSITALLCILLDAYIASSTTVISYLGHGGANSSYVLNTYIMLLANLKECGFLLSYGNWLVSVDGVRTMILCFIAPWYYSLLFLMFAIISVVAGPSSTNVINASKASFALLKVEGRVSTKVMLANYNDASNVISTISSALYIFVTCISALFLMRYFMEWMYKASISGCNDKTSYCLCRTKYFKWFYINFSSTFNPNRRLRHVYSVLGSTGSGKTTAKQLCDSLQCLKIIDLDAAIELVSNRKTLEDVRRNLTQATGDISAYMDTWGKLIKEHFDNEFEKVPSGMPVLVVGHLEQELDHLELPRERYLGFVNLPKLFWNDLIKARSVKHVSSDEKTRIAALTETMLNSDANFTEGFIPIDWPDVLPTILTIKPFGPPPYAQFPILGDLLSTIYVPIRIVKRSPSTSLEGHEYMIKYKSGSEKGSKIKIKTSDTYTVHGQVWAPFELFENSYKLFVTQCDSISPVSYGFDGSNIKVTNDGRYTVKDSGSEVHVIKYPTSLPSRYGVMPNGAKSMLTAVTLDVSAASQLRKMTSESIKKAAEKSSGLYLASSSNDANDGQGTSGQKSKDAVRVNAEALALGSMASNVTMSRTAMQPLAVTMSTQTPEAPTFDLNGKPYEIGEHYVTKVNCMSAPTPFQEGTKNFSTTKFDLKFFSSKFNADMALLNVRTVLPSSLYKSITDYRWHGNSPNAAGTLKRAKGMVIRFSSEDDVTTAVQNLVNVEQEVCVCRPIADVFSGKSDNDQAVSEGLISSLTKLVDNPENV
jgi:hypothetical protein